MLLATAGACANSGVVSPVGSGISKDHQYFEKASDDRLSPTGMVVYIFII